MRDSYISNDSNSTYPSTMTTLSGSGLGLTDSPTSLHIDARPSAKRDAPLPALPLPDLSTNPAHRKRVPINRTLAQQRSQSKQDLRNVASNSSLPTLYETQADNVDSSRYTRASPASRERAEKRPQELSEQSRRFGEISQPPSPAKQTAVRPATAVQQKKPGSLPSRASVQMRHKTSDGELAPKDPIRASGWKQSNALSSQVDRTADHSLPRGKVPATNGPAVAIPTRPQDKHDHAAGGQDPVRTQPGTSSPAKSVASLADEWDAELSKDAARLRLSPVLKPAQPYRTARDEREFEREKEEQRKKDREWEMSGMWTNSAGNAREAEERTRREAGREIGNRVPKPGMKPAHTFSVPTCQTASPCSRRSDRYQFYTYRCKTPTSSFLFRQLHRAKPAESRCPCAPFLAAPIIADDQFARGSRW